MSASSHHATASPADASSAPSLFAERILTDDFTAQRLRWLIDLRWVAMIGVLVAAAFAATGAYPGIEWRVMLGVVGVGSVYNFILLRQHIAGRARVGRVAAVNQALIDMGMLTIVLWSAGGVDNPFLVFYIFHIALIAILGGPRATVAAVLAAFVMAGLLAMVSFVPSLQIGVWNPSTGWNQFAEGSAFVCTVTAASYVVSHAVREVRDREAALRRARDRAALEYQVISNTLDELEAGLEVVDPDGSVAWRNRRAAQLAPGAGEGEPWVCPMTRTCDKPKAECPVPVALTDGTPGRCRFAASREHTASDPGVGTSAERVYEMLTFPLTGDHKKQRVMNLYIDRTNATLAEQQLVLAERLASLGRIAQGVAHELNTPLATIRTLATDMRETVPELRAAGTDPAARDALTADISESAQMIRDETIRLGRITQSLLAGGDLVRPNIEGGVSLGSVVERARALVMAGLRGGPTIKVDSGVDAIYVAADADRVMQILVNMLQNAVDALRENGGHRIQVHARIGPVISSADATTSRSGSNDVAVFLMVDDDGPGISPEIRARLFEPFATTKPQGEGTGLGLYASYMLAQSMDGDLSLEPRPEGGARATMRLPVGDPPEGVTSTWV